MDTHTFEGDCNDREEGGRAEHDLQSKSPERPSLGHKESSGQKVGGQGSEGQTEPIEDLQQEGQWRGREGRPKERVRDDRSRRERSIEEDWTESGSGGGRRARGRGEWSLCV